MADEYRDLATFDGVSGFEGAVGKIVRARYQLRDLSDRFQTFLSQDPVRLISRYEATTTSTGVVIFEAESVSLPKREIGILLGEVVHNLRTALDHAVYAAAAKPSNDHQFPVVKRAEAWDDKVGRLLDSVPDNVVELIESVQPFQATSIEADPHRHVLSVLHKLSNLDKHRYLHTAAFVPIEMEPVIRPIRDVRSIQSVTTIGGVIEARRALVRVEIETHGPDPQLVIDGGLKFDLAFADPAGEYKMIEGARVLPVLTKALELVEHTVVKVEFLCAKDPR